MTTTNQPLTEEQKKTRNKEYLERYRVRQKYNYESLVKQNSIKAAQPIPGPKTRVNIVAIKVPTVRIPPRIIRNHL